MEFRDFTAGKDDDGRRLDRVLRIFLKDAGLGEIYKLLRKGLIKVNQKKAKPETHLAQGDVISIAEFLLNSDRSDKSDKPAAACDSLKIVFENEHLLIIDKPYGRSVHGSEKNESGGLDKDVLAWYQAEKADSNDSLSFRPGPLHRLDRNTTGLLVFSLSLKGAQWFSEGIKNHTIRKKYYGIAGGNLKNTENWEDKLADSAATEEGFYTVAQADDGLLSKTCARPLAYGNFKGKAVTLVEYSIETGRKHQIRSQSQIHGYPLLGDKAYGGAAFSDSREYYLQAFSLSFPQDNPLGLPSEIKIPLSKDFIRALECCEIKNPGL